MFEWPLFRVLWCSASKSGGEREKSIKAVYNKNKKKRKKGKKKQAETYLPFRMFLQSVIVFSQVEWQIINIVWVYF
jgi:hypothetical protein